MPATSKSLPRYITFPASMLLILILIPLLFYVQFGYVDGYAFACAAFLMLIAGGADVLIRRADRFKDEKPPKFKPGPFDWLGGVWLLSIPFAPFFSWALTNLFEPDVTNWRELHAIRAFMCIVVPCVCVLPLLRCLRHPHIAFALSILLVFTAFPVATATQSAIDVIRGPAWQSVNITDIIEKDFSTRAGTHVHVPQAWVVLADGRKLSVLRAVPKLHKGPAELLVLRALGQVLDSHQKTPEWELDWNRRIREGAERINAGNAASP